MQIARDGTAAASPRRALAALRKAVEAEDRRQFVSLARKAHPADLASALSGMATSRLHTMLDALPISIRAETFGYLEPDEQHALAEGLSRTALAELLRNMSPDERVDVFNRLRDEQRQSFLPALAHAEREDLRALARYPEGSVGAVMTSDYATVPLQLTASAAIEHLRAIAPDSETIYQAYVVDDRRRLIGTVSLKDLVISPPATRIAALMDADPVFVRADAARADAARLIARYDLIALPVVDADDRLVGIVTYDDAMDVVEEEATEDFRRVGAVEPTRMSLRHAGVALLYRKRVFWLVVLLFGNLVSGATIAYFQDTIAAHLALIFFLPLLIASSGNAGSQSATLMVRALATGEIEVRDWTRLLLREVAVSTLLGATMAAAVCALGWWRGGPEIALVVALTMVIVVVAGSVIGMGLPFLLDRLRLDPAASSAPLITSIADGVGVVVYFALATTVLGRSF